MAPVLDSHFFSFSKPKMSVWPFAQVLSTVLTPLTLLCVLLGLRLRSLTSRLHVLFLTLIFLPVQHFSLAHANSVARTALQHRQLVYATVGALVHVVTVGVVSAVTYGFVALFGMLLACAFVANEQNLDPRVQNFFKELSSRIPANWRITTRSTSTRTESVGDTTVSTTVTTTEDVRFQPESTEHSDMVDKLVFWASLLAPIVANLPADFVNVITPFVIAPSHTLLLMGPSSRLGDAASVSDIIKLATAGAVGLWFTRVLLVSMWSANNSNRRLQAALGALKSTWWFLLGVAAQVYVSANIAQRDIFRSGPGPFRIAKLVLQFRLAIRVVDAVQQWIKRRFTDAEIWLEGVKAFFVAYFGIVCLRVVVHVLHMEEAKNAVA